MGRFTVQFKSCGFSVRSVKDLARLASTNADNDKKNPSLKSWSVDEQMAWISVVSLFFCLYHDHVIKVSTHTFFTVKHNI